MAKLNTKTVTPRKFTHEGAPAKRTTLEQDLIRSTCACLLWEDSFYESGQDIATRINTLVPQVDPAFVANLAVRTRGEFKLRHAPLWLTNALLQNPKGRPYVAETIFSVVQRADELTELLAMYWKKGKRPLANSLKKGLGKAFTKFDEYQLAKYNRDGDIKLRDVLFLTHPKAKSQEQQEMWNRLVKGELKTPDTWETNLSAGADKKATFERLIRENKLGALAVLRNLRNMQEAKVDRQLIISALQNMKVERVLPFRFVAAERYAREYSQHIEAAMLKCCESLDKMNGRTAILVDISGSMFGPKISQKSELDRADAACALAVLLREICSDVDVYSFDTSCRIVRPSRGFALIDAIKKSGGGGTNIGTAVRHALSQGQYDRIIVITDEQSHDRVSDMPKGTRGYMVNVAAYKNGVGYGGGWTNITGFSENLIRYIQEVEKF